MQSQKTINTLSRRNWLRNAAIATTSAAVMPSLLTSCTDHMLPQPGGGLGSAQPFTDENLKNASDSLINMRKWYEELDKRNDKYITAVYNTLKGGDKPPTDWVDILIDVFESIGISILQAAVAAVPLAGPAIAIAAKEIQKWSADKSSGGSVDTAFGEFRLVLDEVYGKVDDRLRELAEPANNYLALREAFINGETFEFNGKTYDLHALAAVDNKFPEENSAQFVKLITPAELSFKKTFWKAIIIKAGKMEGHNLGPWQARHYGNGTAYDTALRELYSDKSNVSSYIRGTYEELFDIYHFYRWVFTFDGLELSADAAKILFIDDAPGNDNNPAGFFARDDVYKQFHAVQPEFRVNGWTYYDMKKDGGFKQDSFQSYNWNFDFKGAAFPV